MTNPDTQEKITTPQEDLGKQENNRLGFLDDPQFTDIKEPVTETITKLANEHIVPEEEFRNNIEQVTKDIFSDPVYNIDKDQKIANAQKIFLGIDEHSFHGRDYVLVITDIKQRRPLAVLSDNKIETLKKWLKSLPNEVKDKIIGISRDMNRGYKNVVEGEYPNVLSTVDKYHLFQEANRMMDDVRGMNTWLIKIGFVTPDDLVKHGKVPKELMKGKKNQRLNYIGFYKKNTYLLIKINFYSLYITNDQ